MSRFRRRRTRHAVKRQRIRHLSESWKLMSCVRSLAARTASWTSVRFRRFQYGNRRMMCSASAHSDSTSMKMPERRRARLSPLLCFPVDLAHACADSNCEKWLRLRTAYAVISSKQRSRSVSDKRSKHLFCNNNDRSSVWCMIFNTSVRCSDAAFATHRHLT